MFSKNGLTIVKIIIFSHYPNFFTQNDKLEYEAYASAGVTETKVLSFLPLRNSTTPSVNANKV